MLQIILKYIKLVSLAIATKTLALEDYEIEY